MLKVLSISDDLGLVNSIRYRLWRGGFSVDDIDTGKNQLTQCLSRAFGLVIVDERMQVRRGWDPIFRVVKHSAIKRGSIMNQTRNVEVVRCSSLDVAAVLPVCEGTSSSRVASRSRAKTACPEKRIGAKGDAAPNAPGNQSYDEGHNQ